MRVLLQRVKWGRVTVDQERTGEIEGGVVALVGIGKGDDPSTVRSMVKKVCNLRIFEDAEGRMNTSLLEVGGGCLVVSQFTLYADCTRGRRPSFGDAGPPEMAEELCDLFADEMEAAGVPVGRGRFGAMMAVELCNDGPVTLWLDSEVSR